MTHILKKIQVIVIQVIQAIRNLVLSTMKTPAEALRTEGSLQEVKGGSRKLGTRQKEQRVPVRYDRSVSHLAGAEAGFLWGYDSLPVPPAPHNAAAQTAWLPWMFSDGVHCGSFLY